MTKYIALLRAVNVGGTGKLPMARPVELCGEAGFTGTCIARAMQFSKATPPKVT